MYEIENISRPYILDVVKFNEFIIGKAPLSEKEFEDMIFNEHKICKIILDGLKDTVGYLTCSIIDKSEAPANFSKFLNEGEKIAYFYHSSINDEFEDNLFIRLYNNFLFDLDKKNIKKIIIKSNSKHEKIEDLEYNKIIKNDEIYYFNF